MENLIWAVILWAVVFIAIPFERIRQLWMVPLITMAWFFTVNYFFIHWGYYRFTHVLISFFGVPFIQNIGGGAGGLLLINWLKPHPLSKLMMVLLGSAFFSLSEYVFRLFNAFEYGNGFNPLISFVHTVAMISILIWLLLALAGRDRIYSHVNKTGF